MRGVFVNHLALYGNDKLSYAAPCLTPNTSPPPSISPCGMKARACTAPTTLRTTERMAAPSRGARTTPTPKGCATRTIYASDWAKTWQHPYARRLPTRSAGSALGLSTIKAGGGCATITTASAGVASSERPASGCLVGAANTVGVHSRCLSTTSTTSTAARRTSPYRMSSRVNPSPTSRVNWLNANSYAPTATG